MELGAKNESGRATTSEPISKSDKPSFKIKIPFKKLSGKHQQASSDLIVHATFDGNSTSNTDTSMSHDGVNKHHGTDLNNLVTSLTAPSSALDSTHGCIPIVESSQRSISTSTNYTQENDSTLIDIRSAHENKKSEPTQRSTRFRTSSFDVKDDFKSTNNGPSMDDKLNRAPVTTNTNHNHAQESNNFESSALITSRQANSGSDSKELRESITTSLPTSSFLDTLNEDERRVRTRHLPAAAGFHRLHKKEVSNDLSMVKNTLKNMLANLPKTKRVVSDETGQKYGDKMGIDEEDAVVASDEDSSSDASGAALKGISKLTSHMYDSRMDLIASSFSTPYPVNNYVLTELDEIPSSTSDYRHLLLQSPQIVESLTTFNPPRPPESVGQKKKNRVMRWEKNPDDIEKDLKNYRKTVRRTKEELQKTIRERERMETVGCFIRSLFMNHLIGMKVENEYLVQQLNHLQNEAYRLIDGDSRTKTRYKGSSSKAQGAMKDVMTFINSHKKAIFSPLTKARIRSSNRCGIPFTSDACSSQEWLVHGDIISSPYGKGTVVKVIGPQICYEIPTVPSLAARTNADAVFSVIPTRVCVRLSYGTAYLSPLIINHLENTSTFTTDKLAKRWTAMLESSTEFSTILDPAFHSIHGVNLEPDDGVSMAQILNGSNKTQKAEGVNDDGIQIGLLVNHPIDSLFQDVEKVFESDHCVLAQAENTCIPRTFLKSEERRREIQILEGQVLQLRNEVSRQRKLRIATEKSQSSNQDRTQRCESLLSEMYTDMISLKERLNEDLVELGIDQEKAAEILSDFYSIHFANGSSPSISRKRKFDEYEHELEAKSGLFMRDVASIHCLSDRFSERMTQENEDSVDLEHDERGV